MPSKTHRRRRAACASVAVTSAVPQAALDSSQADDGVRSVPRWLHMSSALPASKCKCHHRSRRRRRRRRRSRRRRLTGRRGGGRGGGEGAWCSRRGGSITPTSSVAAGFSSGRPARACGRCNVRLACALRGCGGRCRWRQGCLSLCFVCGGEER